MNSFLYETWQYILTKLHRNDSLVDFYHSYLVLVKNQTEYLFSFIL